MEKVLIIFLLFFNTTGFAEENVLTFSNNGNSENKLNEISITVSEEAYEKIGIDIKVELMPSFRSVRFANSGITDGEVNRIKGFEKQFKNLILVPVPIKFCGRNGFYQIF